MKRLQKIVVGTILAVGTLIGSEYVVLKSDLSDGFKVCYMSIVNSFLGGAAAGGTIGYLEDRKERKYWKLNR